MLNIPKIACGQDWLCCDRKSRASSAQSSAPRQQATIEITRRDHSIIACSRHVFYGVVLHAHPVRGESCISAQRQRRGCNRIAWGPLM